MKQIAIKLFHGRQDPKVEMDEWGEAGPVLGPFYSFHVTYMSDYRFIDDGESEADLKVVEGMIYYDGMYYGDWVISTVDVFKSEGYEIEKWQDKRAIIKVRRAEKWIDLPIGYWDFVEKHYPNYSGSDVILHNDILSRYAHYEEVDSEDIRSVQERYLVDNEIEAEAVYMQDCVEIYNNAVDSYNSTIPEYKHTKKYATIRKDLLEEGIGVPVGEEFYSDSDPIQYRWVDNSKAEKPREEEIFQVLLNGEWKEAQSIDFDF